MDPLLAQVDVPSGPTRAEVTQIAEIFRARVNDVSDSTLTMSVTGDPGKVRFGQEGGEGGVGQRIQHAYAPVFAPPPTHTYTHARWPPSSALWPSTASWSWCAPGASA